jgi:hypothetical protein
MRDAVPKLLSELIPLLRQLNYPAIQLLRILRMRLHVSFCFRKFVLETEDLDGGALGFLRGRWREIVYLILSLWTAERINDFWTAKQSNS